MGCLSLALALGAEEGRAAGLDDAPDALGAGAAGAGLALPAIDRPAVLEIAELAIGLDVIAQRRPAGLDRLAENLADRRGEPLGPRADDRRGEPARRQPGAKERLADIDVAEPGDDALIEQGRLDRGQLAGQDPVEIGAVKTRLQRLGTHPRQ